MQQIDASILHQLDQQHSGNTNQGGCHMNYATAEYHCHNRKQTNPYQTY